MNKKVIAFILFLIIILLIFAVIIFCQIKISQNGSVNEIEYTEEILNSQEVSSVKNNNLFYTIESCIQKYETYLNLDYTELVDEFNMPSIAAVYGIDNEEKKINAIMSTLDKDYISENSINTTNIFQFVNSSVEGMEVRALEINKLIDDNENVEAYVVNAELINEDNDARTTEMFITKIDNKNMTFSIYPLNKSEYNNINDVKIINRTKTIEKNEYNTYIYMDYNDSQIATNYFQEFKELMLNNPSEAYKKLDDTYKTQKFSNEQNFIQYTIKNKSKIEQFQVIKYQVNKEEEYTQYVCMKTNMTYWIIKEIAPRNYTVILDTYTVNLPEFLEKYNTSSEQVKVGMNIEKIFQAINDGDYEYVYSKLDNTFKQNNFPTIISFENYIKQNFYENNKIGYSNYKTSGDLHVYTLNITDNNNSNNSIEKDFIMQLKEGTDFVMSFNV